METYRRWLEKTVDNEEIHGELVSVQEDPAAIEDRFYRELEFGTGGLRGVLGAGSNRMNVYTVGKATQGYSNYLKKNFQDPAVAIAYDSRIHSDLFARTAAAIFAANGIRVHLYPKLMPTPSLSFAVRDLHCSGGIVITASHNPAKYNGYKVYGSDGCQITTEAAKAIQQEIDGVDAFADVPKADFQAQLQSGRITYIGEDTVERYLAAIAGVDPTLYEAAKIDGCKRFGLVRFITFPCILPIIAVMLIMQISNIMNAGFDSVYNLYNKTVYDVADIIDTLVYRLGVSDGEIEQSTAVGLFKNVINFILLLTGNWLTKKMCGYSMYSLD